MNKFFRNKFLLLCRLVLFLGLCCCKKEIDFRLNKANELNNNSESNSFKNSKKYNQLQDSDLFRNDENALAQGQKFYLNSSETSATYQAYQPSNYSDLNKILLPNLEQNSNLNSGNFNSGNPNSAQFKEDYNNSPNHPFLAAPYSDMINPYQNLNYNPNNPISFKDRILIQDPTIEHPKQD